MAKKTVRDIDLKNRKVLVRVDFNVPIKEGRSPTTPGSRGAADPEIHPRHQKGPRSS